MKLLITRPEHDLETQYLSVWSKDIISLAEKQNISIKDLRGNLANMINFEKFVKKQNPSLILLNGHGNEFKVCGHENKDLLDETNISLTKNKLVHALACSSAKVLGKQAVQKGAKEYLGYSRPFMFITDKYNECRPGFDKFANIFKEPALEAPKFLIKGKAGAEAVLKAKEKYREAILNLSDSNNPEEAESIRFALFSNMISLECHSA
ncbi:hypothetical protein HOK51_03970 [Candidatus Woesearchaeota archaeon]|jgi:hypothetical protein|nr:hypothetical protein [Candidatus Woesearchaeota archaeon]MBT6518980.1 hypothetical protein [Candidatus Woesearchaeota archaeon]MBT7368345.1 hypothetical protein [Candidatus Woesearchaeota archaeon]